LSHSRDCRVPVPSQRSTRREQDGRHYGEMGNILVGTSKQTPSLLCHVVGFCMHARAHTGSRSHVTFFHGKRVEEYYTSDSARASATNALVSPDTPRCGIARKPNHDTVMPAHALVHQLVLPCATILVHALCAPQPLPRHPAATTSSVV